MKYRKVILSIFILLFAANFAFGQSEALKVVANSLGFYKNTKDVNYLARAKKSVDSLIVSRRDSNNIEKLVYKGLVYATILQEDTLNKLNQPADFFTQTAQFVDTKLSMHRKIRQYPDELKFIRQCLANACIREGFKYMDKSDFINAERYFSKARVYIPEYKTLNVYLAYSNNKLGNLQTAAKFYNNLINSDNITAEHIQAAANINMAVGDTAMALEIIQKGKKLLPGDKFLMLDEANIYNNKRDYKALLPLLPALLNEYKTNAEVVLVAANCYDRLGMYDKAEEMYLQAIDLNSAAFDPVFNLALLYYKKSVIDKDSDGVLKNLYYATRWFEKANEILPADVKSLQLLQQIYTQTGNTRQLNKINSKLKQLTEITYEN
ncbi:tetratricopeptide repeat protein [Mucilaginibacter limnophilus]|uniref:Tetratricopeptide repeat protein n=1 Tax=Mucilaginibacter limnophilus TaxID=1932778 RepID=A0A437MTC2_9SPHI|nr:tetratricopeptide repeat protein [Mucilaginibacter limnophilus]RVU00905.1 tetratricopeptide repeat protein [Mucilaginibacter limnophilus]